MDNLQVHFEETNCYQKDDSQRELQPLVGVVLSFHFDQPEAVQQQRHNQSQGAHDKVEHERSVVSQKAVFHRLPKQASHRSKNAISINTLVPHLLPKSTRTLFVGSNIIVRPLEATLQEFRSQSRAKSGVDVE